MYAFARDPDACRHRRQRARRFPDLVPRASLPREARDVIVREMWFARPTDRPTVAAIERVRTRAAERR